MLDADDVIARIDMMDFPGDAARHIRQEIDAGIAHFCDKLPRLLYVPPANANCRPVSRAARAWDPQLRR